MGGKAGVTGKTVRIRDLGGEAINELLQEAARGMGERSGQRWTLSLDDEGELTMRGGAAGRLVVRANVRPRFLRPARGERVDGEPAPGAVALLRALRANVLSATSSLTPVPADADLPGAMASAWSAVEALERIAATTSHPGLVGLRHDLYRILDSLTGQDHSGCTGRLTQADFAAQALPPEHAPEGDEPAVQAMTV